MISKNQIKFVKSLETKKHRTANGLFVAEGPKVVGDLLTAGFKPVQLFATEEWTHTVKERNIHIITPTAPHSTAITTDELSKLSFLQHPQQVLALFPIPNTTAATSSSLRPASRLTLVLDGVQDPGNLGTIIRVADWYGIDTIVCSADTADCWSPKVVQATMGSIARVTIIYTDLKQYLSAAQLPVYGTVLDGNNIYNQDLPADAIIVMGNEGSGISPTVRQLLTHRLLIPSYRPGAESLNVAIATAITCSEFRRKAL